MVCQWDWTVSDPGDEDLYHDLPNFTALLFHTKCRTGLVNAEMTSPLTWHPITNTSTLSPQGCFECPQCNEAYSENQIRQMSQTVLDDHFIIVYTDHDFDPSNIPERIVQVIDGGLTYLAAKPYSPLDLRNSRLNLLQTLRSRV